MTHKKPSAEELAAGIQKSQDELDKLDTPPKSNEPPTPAPQPSEPIPSEPAPSSEPEEAPSKEPEPSQPEPSHEPEPSKAPEPTPSKEPIDENELERIKKNYADSTREAQFLYRNNVAVMKAIEDGNNLQPPTDDEMKTVYAEWEDMSETEKRLAREGELNKRKFNLLNEAAQVTKNTQAWNEKVDKFIGDPKTLTTYPELEGKEDDFKIYASAKEGIGAHFDVLVSAFLHDLAKSRKPKKGKMFESGTGGPKEKPQQKSDKISITEARTLMKTDYKKYVSYLKAGKIDMSQV